MTLKEKKDLQKKVVNELYSYIEERPILFDNFIDFLRIKFEELIDIEMSYYNASSINKVGYNDVIVLKLDTEKSYHKGVFTMGKYDEKNNLCMPHRITVYLEWAFDGLLSFNYSERVRMCAELLTTLFHEITHLRQHLMVRNGIASYYNLRNAKEEMLHSYCADRFYDLNSNKYFTESDANYNSLLIVRNLYSFTPYDLARLEFHKSNRDIAPLLTWDNGIVDRDTYIDRIIDNIISRGSSLSSFEGYAVLIKEFNEDCSKRTFSNLKSNYNLELNASYKIEDKKKRKEIINDLNSLYYHLFNKKIIEGNIEELNEALNEFGINEINKLLNKLLIYNKNEKVRRFELINNRVSRINETHHGKRYFEVNNGFLMDQERVVGTREYINSMEIYTLSKRIKKFVTSETFRNMLPIYGYYITKSGNKMSIHDFIFNILVPRLKEFSNDEDQDFFEAVYYELLEENFISSYEMDSIESKKILNMNYNRLENQINKYHNLINNEDFILNKKDNNLLGNNPLLCYNK